jgi:hypothetical protein
MFKNSDSDSDTKDEHMHSGRVLREVHLANLFKQNYGDEGFYSGEEVDLTGEEHSESARTEEPREKSQKLQELRRLLT